MSPSILSQICTASWKFSFTEKFSCLVSPTKSWYATSVLTLSSSLSRLSVRYADNNLRSSMSCCSLGSINCKAAFLSTPMTFLIWSALKLFVRLELSH